MTPAFDLGRLRQRWQHLPHRRALLAAAALVLAAIAGLIAWRLAARPAGAPPGRAAAPIAASGASAPGKTEAGEAAAIVDIFAVRTWVPALVMAQPSHGPAGPPPEAAPPPPPPEPPALPFRFLGRIAEPGKGPAYMLSRGNEVLVVRVGDPVGSDYRLEQYKDGDLIFHYQPMDIRQTLAIGVQP